MEEHLQVLDEVPVLFHTAKNTRGSASGVRNSSPSFCHQPPRPRSARRPP